MILFYSVEILDVLSIKRNAFADPRGYLPLPTPQGPRFPYFDFFVENLAKNMRSRDLRSASGIALAVIQSDVVF